MSVASSSTPSQEKAELVADVACADSLKANLRDGWRMTDAILFLADRYRRWVWAFLILLYAMGTNFQWRLGIDSMQFAIIARYVAEGDGFWHPYAMDQHVHPALIYLVAASFKIFGAGVIWPVIVFVEIAAGFALWLTYRVFVLHSGRPTAVLLTLMVGINMQIFLHAFTVLNGIPFLAGTMLLLLGYERLAISCGSDVSKENTWCSWLLMVGGLVVMAGFRLVVVTVGGAWVLAMVWHAIRSEKSWRNIGLMLAVVFVLVGLRLADPRGGSGGGEHDGDWMLPRERYIVDRVWSTLAVSLNEHVPVNTVILLEDSTPNALFGNEIAPVLDGVISIIVLGAGFWLMRKRPLWGLLVLAMVLQWLFFLPDPRYFLPVIPLLAFVWWKLTVAAEGFWLLRARRVLQVDDVDGDVKVSDSPELKSKLLFHVRLSRAAACVMLVLWLGTNGARVVGLIVEQRRVPFVDHYDEGRFRGLEAFAMKVRSEVAEDAWIVGPVKISTPVMYWSRRHVFPAWANYLIPNNVTPSYIILPQQADAKAIVDNQGWKVGEEVVSEVADQGGNRWSLHRLIVSAKP